MAEERRVVVIDCNDFQGNDPESVQAAFSGAKMIKNVFDGAIEATRVQILKHRNLTAEDEAKLANMTVTVKVMKVNL